jgi:hypothetical protein
MLTLQILPQILRSRTRSLSHHHTLPVSEHLLVHGKRHGTR